VKKNKTLRMSIMMIGLVLVMLTILQSLRVIAGTDNQNNKENVVKSVKLEDDEIDESSLIIGSYVIHISGLNDDINELAKASAREFDQRNVYYKSEMAGGQWFDITDASSFVEITEEGTPVDVAVIEKLSFTHQVSETGEVTDLRYGYAVSVYDITSPYTLWDLEELEAIEEEYDSLSTLTTRNASEEMNLKFLQSFYGKSIRNTTTNKYDNIITGLESYKNELLERGKPSGWMEEVRKVMKQTDAKRRVESYKLLTQNLQQLYKEVSGETQTSEETEFVADASLVYAVERAIDEVEDSSLEYSSLVLLEGTTVSSKAIYKYTNNLMNGVTSTTKATEYDNLPWYSKWFEIWLKVRSTVTVNYNKSTCDAATQKLADITNIYKGTIVDAESEKDTLELFISDALSDYKKKLTAGVSKSYKNAVMAKDTQALKDRWLQGQKEETDVARLEYESMLTLSFERMSNQSLQKQIENLLNEIPKLENSIPKDAVQKYQLETVAEHREWLRKALAQAMKESTDSTEMDTLMKEMAELETERQSALDCNDLAKAQQITVAMEAKQKEIDALTGKLVNVLASTNSTEAEKARALVSLEDGNVAGVLYSMASVIASGIRNDGTIVGIQMNSDTTNSSQSVSSNSTSVSNNSTASKTGSSGSTTKKSVSGNSAKTVSGNSAKKTVSGNGVWDGLIGKSLSKEEMLDKIAAFGAVCSLDADSAMQAIVVIEEAIENAASLEAEYKSALEEAISDVKQIINQNLAKKAGDLSIYELTAKLEEILGISLDEATEEELAAAVIALERMGKAYNNRDAKSLSLLYANRMYEDGSPYAYLKYVKEAKEYISVKAISEILGYRYIFDDAKSGATLSKGRDYYSFEKQSTEYTYTNKQSDYLKAPAGFQDVIYIWDEDAKKLFDAEAIYVSDCDLAIVATSKVNALAEEIYKELEDN